jgi:hypothetical protein
VPQKTIALSRETRQLLGYDDSRREVSVTIPEQDFAVELHIHGHAGIDTFMMGAFLTSLWAAYARLRSLELVLQADFGQGVPWHQSFRPERGDAARAIRLLSQDLYQAFRSPIIVTGVSLHSPGLWEFMASLNPLEAIRKFLQDGHERKKDRQYRNSAEETRLRIENERAAVALAKDKLDLEAQAGHQMIDLASQAVGLADRLQLESRQRNQLVNYFVKAPLKKLRTFQDAGVIETADFFDDGDPSYEKQRDRKFTRAVHFIPQLASATEFDRASSVEKLVDQIDLDSLSSADQDLARRLVAAVLEHDSREILSSLMLFFTSLENALRASLPAVVERAKFDWGQLLRELQIPGERGPHLSLGDLLRIAKKVLEIQPEPKWQKMLELRNRLFHGNFSADTEELEAVSLFLSSLSAIRDIERRILFVTGDQFSSMFPVS